MDAEAAALLLAALDDDDDELDFVSGLYDEDDLYDDEDALVPDLILNSAGEIVSGDPEEVGRLIKNRKARKALAAMFGGPAAWAGMGIKRRRNKKKRRRQQAALAQNAALQAAARTAALGALASARKPRAPKTAGDGMVPGSQRRLLLPFERQTFEPGESFTLESRVEKAMQPDRLVIYTSAPEGTVVVHDLKHGVDTQLAAVGVMPVEAFKANADTGLLLMDPVRPGNRVTIPLQSLEPVPATGPSRRYVVSAVMYGIGAN